MATEQYIYIGDTKQVVLYMMLPRSKADDLFVSLPRLLLEKVADWVDSKKPSRLYIQNGSNKFTVYEAAVKVDKLGLNRYGAPAHDLLITYSNMVRGICKEAT